MAHVVASHLATSLVCSYCNTIALGIWDNLTAQLLNFKNGVILEHACVDASRLILVLVSDQVFVTRRCLIVSMSIHSGLTRTEKLC